MEMSWAFKKTRALDSLIEVTLHMLSDYQNGEFNDSGTYIQKRNELTQTLQECDDHLAEPTDDMVHKWLEQINKIQDLDNQIEIHFRTAKEKIRKKTEDLYVATPEKKTNQVDTLARLNSPLSKLIN